MANSLGLSVNDWSGPTADTAAPMAPVQDWSAEVAAEAAAADEDWSVGPAPGSAADDWVAPAEPATGSGPATGGTEKKQARPKPKKTASSQDARPGPAPAAEGDQDAPQTGGERKVPYVNRNRAQTGGPTRDKLSPEELEAKMADIRKRNQQIKEKRELVLADEAAFKQQVADDAATSKARVERRQQVQNRVNHERNQNAQRKLDKIAGREWDSTKGDSPAAAGRGPNPNRDRFTEDASQPSEGNWKLARQQQDTRPDRPYKAKQPAKPKNRPPKPEGEGGEKHSNTGKRVEESDSSASDDDAAVPGPGNQRGRGRGRGGRGGRGSRGGARARARTNADSTDEEAPKTAQGSKPPKADVQQDANWAGDVANDKSGW